MSKSRIFLKGVVSASILAMGAAGPALANTSQVASAAPASAGSSVLPVGGLTGTSPLRGVAGILPDPPAADRVANGADRVANHTDRVADRVGGTAGVKKTSGRVANGAVKHLNSSLPSSGRVNSDLRTATVPGLPGAGNRPSTTGALSSLGSATGNLGSITSAVPGVSSVNSDLPGFRR